MQPEPPRPFSNSSGKLGTGLRGHRPRWLRSVSRGALFSLIATVGACSKPKASHDTQARSTPASAASQGAPKPAPSQQRTTREKAGRESPSQLEIRPGVLLEPKELGASEKRPLLVYLHGLGGSGASSVQALGLVRVADEQRMFVYAPDGAKDSSGRGFWNAHPACCNFDNQTIDDVATLRDAIEQLTQRPQIDPARVYVMGHSNGGFMALRLACEMGDQLAAVVSVAGAGPPMDSKCNVSTPIHVLLVHGDRDAIVRYEGGSVFDDPERPVHGSARETLKGWAKRLGCSDTPKPAAALNLDARQSGAETRVLRHEGCARGSAQLWTIRGGSHFVISNLNLWQEVLKFFVAHAKG